MPERIVERYLHLYQKSDYRELHKELHKLGKIHLGSPPVIVKAFGIGEPDDFPNHFIQVLVENHVPEYLAVTTITKHGSERLAKVSMDHCIIGLEKNLRKIHLAYEWIHVILVFCKRGFGKLRYTLAKETNKLFCWLSENTIHCAKHLSDFDREMHRALRKLLVSNRELENTLLRMSISTGSKIICLKDLKQFMQTNYTQTYNTITWPLIQSFALEWDVDQTIVESRLQEILGLSL